MNLDYRVAEGRVQVLDGDELLWSGHVDGMVANQAMALPGTDDGIVVMDWSQRPAGVEECHPYPNLLRITPNGRAVWTATLPQAEKSYTGASWQDGKLLGYLWSHTAELDPNTGVVVRCWFAK